MTYMTPDVTMRALRRFRRGGSVHPEVGIAALAGGIEAFCRANQPEPFGAEFVVWPLITAFRQALSYDCGTLDCGTLDGWAADLAASWCIDPDTGEWVGVLDGDNWRPPTKED